jgi:hypothetical protein
VTRRLAGGPAPLRTRTDRGTTRRLLSHSPAPVVYGGTSIHSLFVGDAGYTQNELRQDLWWAGHAHAGTLAFCSSSRWWSCVT